MGYISELIYKHDMPLLKGEAFYKYNKTSQTGNETDQTCLAGQANKMQFQHLVQIYLQYSLH